jgi:hypothetical protein
MYVLDQVYSSFYWKGLVQLCQPYVAPPPSTVDLPTPPPGDPCIHMGFPTPCLSFTIPFHYWLPHYPSSLFSFHPSQYPFSNPTCCVRPFLNTAIFTRALESDVSGLKSHLHLLLVVREGLRDGD